MRNFKLACAGAALALVVAAPAARAATVVNYTSAPFASSQLAAFGTSLNISLTLDQTLASNFTGQVNETDIASYTFTPVGGSLSPVTGGQNFFFYDLLLTNGQVTYALLDTLSPQLGGIALSAFHDASIPASSASINTYDNDGTLPGNFQNYSLNAGSFTVSNTVSAAPEPGAWALMLLGVGGMGLALRKRRANEGAGVAG